MSLLGWLTGPFACRDEVLNNLKELNMKLSELAVALDGLDTKLENAQVEILNKIAALEATLSDVELPAEAMAAMEDLAATVQALDDIVPDVVPPEPTP